MNSPHGMPWLQLYSFGQRIWTHRCSAVPLRGCAQPSSTVILPSTCDSHVMTTLNDAFECALTSEDIGYKSESESMSVPTLFHQEP